MGQESGSGEFSWGKSVNGESAVAGHSADGYAASLEESAALAFGSPAPDSVLDPVLEGVIEASSEDRAVGTDLLGYFDANAVTREKRGGGLIVAIAC
jgi:hypothetical protein